MIKFSDVQRRHLSFKLQWMYETLPSHLHEIDLADFRKTKSVISSREADQKMKLTVCGMQKVAKWRMRAKPSGMQINVIILLPFCSLSPWSASVPDSNLPRTTKRFKLKLVSYRHWFASGQITLNTIYPWWKSSENSRNLPEKSKQKYGY